MKAIAPETTPHENMMRAIHIRAPTLSRMTFEGTSNRKYERKNTPAPKPNAVSESLRSESIVSLAKPTFTRSR